MKKIGCGWIVRYHSFSVNRSKRIIVSLMFTPGTCVFLRPRNLWFSPPTESFLPIEGSRSFETRVGHYPNKSSFEQSSDEIFQEGIYLHRSIFLSLFFITERVVFAPHLEPRTRGIVEEQRTNWMATAYVGPRIEARITGQPDAIK